MATLLKLLNSKTMRRNVLIQGKERKCVVCKTIKPLSNFRNDKSREFGKAFRCRPCDNILRAARPRTRNQIRTEAQKEYIRNYMNRDRIINRFKWDARRALRDAVKKGEVKKDPCVVCSDSQSEGHHPDHTKPLEVIWLCHRHHMQLEFGKVKPVIN